MKKIDLTVLLTRDSTLRLLGLAGIIYETIVVHVDRPTLLIGFFALLGLPTFISSDEKQAAKLKAIEKAAEDAAKVKPSMPEEAV